MKQTTKTTTITPAQQISQDAHREAMTIMTAYNNAHPVEWRITIPDNTKLRMFIPEYNRAYMTAFNRMLNDYLANNA